jgi:hypothetical protein
MSQNWTPPPPPGGNPAAVPNYLVLAILSVFCCWPLAIVSIINATKVNKLLASGDTAGAMEASKNAKRWAIIAIAIGVGLNLISIVIYIIAAIASR